MIIPTWRRATLLAETLESISSLADQDFEVIVVCDGEDSETRSLAAGFIASYPLTWLFHAENLGLPAARNTGASAARGELLVFLDDDTTPAADWLSMHRAGHHSTHDNERFVILGRCQDVYAQPPTSHTERLLRESRERGLRDFDARCLRNEKDFSWFPHCGMNSSIHRAMFLSAGGYDPARALRESVHEDLDLGTRLFQRGVRFLYEPRALVCHRNPKNLIDHHLQLAKPIGRSDLYRVRQKKQRNSQTQHLAAFCHGPVVRRMKDRFAWEYPEATRRFAEFFRSATDRTGSTFWFQLWRSLSFSAAYWEGVKSEGMTVDSLRELVGAPLRVLMFHSISPPVNELERNFHLTPGRFLRFLDYVRQVPHECVSPLDGMAQTNSLHRIALTFDDGYEDFYAEAFPALTQLRMKATVFLVVDRIGQLNDWDQKLGSPPRKLLTASQIREMHRHGTEFASHSLTHPWLTLLSDDGLRREVADSKHRLEDLLGAEVPCFAYPAGRVDARVRAAVAEAGYRIAMTNQPGLNLWEDTLMLKRIAVRERDSLLGFILKLSTGRSVPEHLFKGARRMTRSSLDRLPERFSRMLEAWLRRLYTHAVEHQQRRKELSHISPGQPMG